MDKYLLFRGDDYEEMGGWRDFDSPHDSIASAIEADAKAPRSDWAHIVSLDSHEIVLRRENCEPNKGQWVKEPEVDG